MDKWICFTGPRNLKAMFAPMVYQVVDSVLKNGRQIAVGCAWGLDDRVRQACSWNKYDPLIFAVKAECATCHGDTIQDPENKKYCLQCSGTGRKYGKGKLAFIKRSEDMVMETWRKGMLAGEPATLIGFPDRPCPAGIYPAEEWTSGEEASGTWSTIALALGMGLQVILFPCAGINDDRETILHNDFKFAWGVTGKKPPWNMSYIAMPIKHVPIGKVMKHAVAQE